MKVKRNLAGVNNSGFTLSVVWTVRSSPTGICTTWWYSDRMSCISSTSSLQISFTTKVRSYDVSSRPSQLLSSFLSRGLRASDTCWWENVISGHKMRYRQSATPKRESCVLILCFVLIPWKTLVSVGPHVRSARAMQMSSLQIEWCHHLPPAACKYHTTTFKFSRLEF